MRWTLISNLIVANIILTVGRFHTSRFMYIISVRSGNHLNVSSFNSVCSLCQSLLYFKLTTSPATWNEPDSSSWNRNVSGTTNSCYQCRLYHTQSFTIYSPIFQAPKVDYSGSADFCCGCCSWKWDRTWRFKNIYEGASTVSGIQV